MHVSVDAPVEALIARLRTLAGDPVAATAAAEGFLAAWAGHFPLVDGPTAHFLHRAADGAVIGVGGDWNGFNPAKGLMAPVGGGLQHYQHTFALDARLDYLIYEASAGSRAGRQQLLPGAFASRPDPLNTRANRSAFGALSELAMPAYRRPPATVETPGVPAGTLAAATLASAALDQVRPYTVYLPAGYDPAGPPYPSIYFQDGGDYLALAGAPLILDNLIAAGAIPPLLAVFVPPLQRNPEYNCNDRYVRFIAGELAPEIGRRYHVRADAAGRAVCGPSLGGLISLYSAARRPDCFGLVAAQSSAVRAWGGPGAFDARTAYAQSPRLPLRLYLSVGSYESCFASDAQGGCRDLLTPLRAFRTTLERAGYPFRYEEHPQGHSWGFWRDTLADALVYLFGAGA